MTDGLETRRWNGTKSAFADINRGYFSKSRILEHRCHAKEQEDVILSVAAAP